MTQFQEWFNRGGAVQEQLEYTLRSLPGTFAMFLFILTYGGCGGFEWSWFSFGMTFVFSLVLVFFCRKAGGIRNDD